MKNYTIDEKRGLLNALENYIDTLDRSRHHFADSSEFFHEILWHKDLRAKLIFDLNPIIVISNNGMYSFNCCLCGQGDDSNYPKQATIEGYGDICFDCFKKYKPELYEKTMKENHSTEVSIDIPEGTDFNNEDSLPF